MKTHAFRPAARWGGLLCGLWMAAAAVAQEVAPPALFQPAASIAPTSVTLPPAFRPVRQHTVQINPDVLAQLLDGRLQWVRLPFFEDAIVDFLVTSSERWGDSSVMLVGRQAGRSVGTAVIGSHQGVVSVTIQSPNSPRWRLETIQGAAGPSSFVAFEEAPDLAGRCGNSELQDAPGPVLPPAPSAEKGLFEPASAAETWVDVAVFYTSVARAAMGGTSSIELHIRTAHLLAQGAHANSDTRTRLRLVHLSEVAYNESGDLNDHLSRLGNATDGFMDSVHAIRESVGADLVHLFVADSGAGTDASTIGLAYTPGTFGVSQINHNYVFAHEVGHNLGCEHELVTSTPPTNYNHALQITETWDLVLETCEQRVRTVMYSVLGNTVPYFSNPSRTYTMGADYCCGEPEFLCTDEIRAVGANSNYLFGIGFWADNARYLRENRSTSSGRLQPAFYVQAGASDGEATQLSPENDLPEVFSQWFPLTEVNPSGDAVPIRFRPGTYGGITRISQKTRLEKWDGSGNARITR